MEKASVIYRHAWDAPRDHTIEFAVYSHGVAERMPPGGVRQGRHVNDWLFIVFHSAATAEVGGREIPVRAGEALVWSPGQMRIYGCEAGEWVHSWVQFSGARVSGLLADAGLRSGVPWPAGRLEVVERGLYGLHAERVARARWHPRILGNLFENWLLEMKRSAQDRAAESGRDVRGRLQVLKTRLDMELDRPLSLGEMGRMAGMSPSHLSALFRAQYGKSPVSYHIARRMEVACYLLANRAMSVGEVAASVGWPEAAAFSRMFKRVVGVSPRAYREGAG